MKAVEAKLDATSFYRVHSAFLVNFAYAESVLPDRLVIRGNEIPISKHRKSLFLAALSEYVASSR